MGYWAEKLKVEKKMKILKRVLLGILLLCILGLCIFSAFVPPESWKYYVQKPDISKRKTGELRIHFLNVGQGDCALLELPDGKIMLIDGGEENGDVERTILRYLNALDIQTLDYLVLTHAQGDHFGGLTEVLRYKKVRQAYLPPAAPDSDKDYAEFFAALIKTGCAWEYSSRKLGALGANADDMQYPYTLTFLSPYSQDVDDALQTGECDDNALSAVLWLDYQGVSALFTGDITAEVESVLVRDDGLGLFENRGVTLNDTEILKVPHHGGVNAASAEFLEYLGVKTAIVSCGKNNPYGHPTQETLERLREAQAEVYRTDESGHILVTVSPNGEYTVDNR